MIQFLKLCSIIFPSTYIPTVDNKNKIPNTQKIDTFNNNKNFFLTSLDNLVFVTRASLSTDKCTVPSPSHSVQLLEHCVSELHVYVSYVLYVLLILINTYL